MPRPINVGTVIDMNRQAVQRITTEIDQFVAAPIDDDVYQAGLAANLHGYELLRLTGIYTRNAASMATRQLQNDHAQLDLGVFNSCEALREVFSKRIMITVGSGTQAPAPSLEAMYHHYHNVYLRDYRNGVEKAYAGLHDANQSPEVAALMTHKMALEIGSLAVLPVVEASSAVFESVLLSDQPDATLPHALNYFASNLQPLL